MLTRLRLKRGEGELVEVNLEIGRVFSKRRMVDETPLGSESQFLNSFMTIHSMVEEMYHEFKKGKGEGTSSPKPDKGVEEPFLFTPLDKEDKGKGEKPPPSPPSSPSSSSSSSSSHKTSSSKKKKNKASLIKLDVKFDLQIYNGEFNV